MLRKPGKYTIGMVHMLTRQLLRLIINYKLIFANSTENDWIDVKERRSDLNQRDRFNSGLRCRRVMERCGGGGGGGGRRRVIGIGEVVNEAVKVRAV